MNEDNNKWLCMRTIHSKVSKWVKIFVKGAIITKERHISAHHCPKDKPSASAQTHSARGYCHAEQMPDCYTLWNHRKQNFAVQLMSVLLAGGHNPLMKTATEDNLRYFSTVHGTLICVLYIMYIDTEQKQHKQHQLQQQYPTTARCPEQH